VRLRDGRWDRMVAMMTRNREMKSMSRHRLGPMNKLRHMSRRPKGTTTLFGATLRLILTWLKTMEVEIC
jgi:hypothetical protein